MSEREWVESILPQLQTAVLGASTDRYEVKAAAARRLPYLHEVLEYRDDGRDNVRPSSYQTDLLVFDASERGWIPRVTIECKLAKVTTHDALTYSAKAATHKQVHPFLRYGILVGDRAEYAIPGRLFRHGAHFDFMATWKRLNPSEEEWQRLVAVLIEEIHTSRNIQTLLTTSRDPNRRKYTLIHRASKFI